MHVHCAVTILWEAVLSQEAQRAADTMSQDAFFESTFKSCKPAAPTSLLASTIWSPEQFLYITPTSTLFYLSYHQGLWHSWQNVPWHYFNASIPKGCCQFRLGVVVLAITKFTVKCTLYYYKEVGGNWWCIGGNGANTQVPPASRNCCHFLLPSS